MLYIVGFWHLDDYTTAFSFNNSYTMFLAACVLGLFVFLSGMLLSSRYSIASFSDVRRFYVRRISRIYPMYALTLLGFRVAGLIKKGQVVKGLLGLNMFTGTPTGTLWFVEMLCIFYLLTPLLLYTYTAWKTLLTGTALSSALYLACRLSHGAVDVRLAQYVLIFAVGIIAGKSEHTERVLTNTLAVACCILALPVLWSLRRPLPGAAAVVVYQAAAIAFVPPAFSGARLATKWLSPTLIRSLTYASFAMYLLHRLTGRLVQSLYRPTSAVPALLYLYCLWLPLTYVLAWAFQRGYDRVCDAIMPQSTRT